MARLTSAAIILLTLAVLLLAVAGPHGVLHLLQVQREIQSLELKNRALETEIVSTKNEIYSIRTNNDALERAAREQAGLSKPGEIVYIMPSNAQLAEIDAAPAEEVTGRVIGEPSRQLPEIAEPKVPARGNNSPHPVDNQKASTAARPGAVSAGSTPKASSPGVPGGAAAAAARRSRKAKEGTSSAVRTATPYTGSSGKK